MRAAVNWKKISGGRGPQGGGVFAGPVRERGSKAYLGKFYYVNLNFPGGQDPPGPLYIDP